MLFYAIAARRKPPLLNNKFNDINYQHDIIKYSCNLMGGYCEDET